MFAPALLRVAGGLTGWLLALVPLGICAFYALSLIEVSGLETLPVTIGPAVHANIALNFYLDGLSVTFALLISGIGALVVIYSGQYLKGHEHLGRFYAFLLAFMGAMLGLVLADNMVVLFTFWELTSVTSFLLIGFDHKRQAARRAAIQALVVTGGGGLALLFGFVILNMITGTWDLSAIRLTDRYLPAQAYPIILTLVLIGAFTKSAQFPFHFWLPNAMEAPTPVSAFLHSATMVQGGVYLLARLSPTLGGTPMWGFWLGLFGGVTLLWGAIAALRQTDLKQMLAQSTVASLGLSVMLIGIGSEIAITAMVAYLVTHALYKAALFLIAGVLDHETGLRDITALGGLRDQMAVSFIATALAVVAMVGLPPALGFLAKEEIYKAVSWFDLLPLLTLVAGNALLGGLALLILIKPFMGASLPTPKKPHEGPFGMLLGPVLLALAGIAAGVMVGWLNLAIIGPTVAAITGHGAEPHMGWAIDLTSMAFLLSVATWVLAGVVFWRADMLRSLLRRIEARLAWNLDKGFDGAMFGLIGLAGRVTRLWHHGRLEVYLFVVFIMLAAALLGPLLAINGLAIALPTAGLTFYEWGVLALALAGVVAVLLARSRLIAVVSLGVQGLAVAMIYLLFGAPDLAFTQLMVEILSVVILALVMTRLDLEKRDTRELEDLMRDGIVALACGAGATLLLLAVLAGTLPSKLADYFTANSVPVAHGHNIVNVILVDFRGLDTLGEIAVVMTAGIAVLALLRRRARPEPAPEPRRPASRQRGRKAA